MLIVGAEKGILRYLLVLELKEPHDGYTINEENTRCISVRMIPTQDAVQVDMVDILLIII